MQKVTIHTDGGCLGNPGPGGWAAVLRCGQAVKEISGNAPHTTNNRMELQAALEALRILNQPCEVQLFTDSQYVRQGISAWIKSWKRRGWKTMHGEPVKNEDLWRALDEAAQPHTLQWRWVRGHAGNADNERCDRLAAAEMAALRGESTRPR